MPIDLFRAIARKIGTEYRGMSVGLFDVCEPTLHPQWIEFIEIAAQRGIRIGFSSNFNIPIDFERLSASGVQFAIISVSGFSQEVYERGHAGGNIDRVHRQMREFAKYRKAATDIKVAYHCYGDNLGDAEYGETKELCQELGFVFYPMISRLNQVKNALNWWLTDRATLDRLAVHPRSYRELNRGKESSPCVMLTENLSINHRGQVQLCCNVPDSNHAGMFLEMTLEEIQAARHRPNDLCRACMGGNIHKLLEYSGTLNWRRAALDNGVKLPNSLVLRMMMDETRWKIRTAVGDRMADRIKGLLGIKQKE
jgi:MoaA/NifB/PqqE/SkfB family radical SAM enzyme